MRYTLIKYKMMYLPFFVMQDARYKLTSWHVGRAGEGSGDEKTGDSYNFPR